MKIVKNIAVLSEDSKGWKKEINLITWNDKDPMYGTRPFRDGRGITLSKEKLMKLKEIEL